MSISHFLADKLFHAVFLRSSKCIAPGLGTKVKFVYMDKLVNGTVYHQGLSWMNCLGSKPLIYAEVTVGTDYNQSWGVQEQKAIPSDREVCHIELEPALEAVDIIVVCYGSKKDKAPPIFDMTTGSSDAFHVHTFDSKDCQEGELESTIEHLRRNLESGQCVYVARFKGTRRMAIWKCNAQVDILFSPPTIINRRLAQQVWTTHD